VWRARRKPHGGGYEEEEGGGVGDPQKSRSASFLLLVTAWPREGSGGGGDRETRGGVVCGLRLRYLPIRSRFSLRSSGIFFLCFSAPSLVPALGSRQLGDGIGSYLEIFEGSFLNKRTRS
jgi:hypothetical protein